jgi:hypothetical protein
VVQIAARPPSAQITTPGDVTGLGRGEEDDHVGDLLWLGGPAMIVVAPTPTTRHREPARPVGYAIDPKRVPVGYGSMSATPSTRSGVPVGYGSMSATPSTRSGVPVGYAIDPKRFLSPTPATPIEAVDGVGDRHPILSMA